MIKRPWYRSVEPMVNLVPASPLQTVERRTRHRACVAMGVVLAGGGVVAFGAGPGLSQSLTPPTPVQAAVTTPPDAADGTGTPPAGSSSVATVAPGRYSDPIADIASVALSSLKGPSTPLTAPATPAPSAAPTTTALGTVNGATTNLSARSQVAIGTGDQTWSAVVLDTSSLSDYYLGIAVVAPSNPKTVAAVSSLPTEGSARYEAAMRQLALMVAERTKVDAKELQSTWARTDPTRMRAVLTALAQVGTMYRYTGNQPGGFDCSGLTSYSWAQAGVKIPRTSTEQIAWAAPRTPETLQPGDIVWRPGHVGLYLGVGDAMVHSPQTGKPVEVRRWGKIARWGSPLNS